MQAWQEHTSSSVDALNRAVSAYDDEEITFPADTWKRRSFPLFGLVRHPPVSTRTVKGAFNHLPALDGLGAYGYHTTSQNKSIDNQQIL